MADISSNVPSIEMVDMSCNIADSQVSSLTQTIAVSQQHTRTEYGHVFGQNGSVIQGRNRCFFCAKREKLNLSRCNCIECDKCSCGDMAGKRKGQAGMCWSDHAKMFRGRST
eukprot:12401710-Ditylum_brightwellii.AAC.3